MSSVLIIEDELPARLRLAEYLESFAVRDIVSAENGAQGLELFQRYEPDLVITDIQMPVMSGLSFLESIRRSGSQVPVIILSCHESFAYARKAIQLGVSSYLIKDLASREELFLAVRRYLPGATLSVGSVPGADPLSMAIRAVDQKDAEQLQSMLERSGLSCENVAGGVTVVRGIDDLETAEEIRESVGLEGIVAHFGIGSEETGQALKALEVAELYNRPDIMTFDRTMQLPGPVPSTIYRHLSELDDALIAKDRPKAKASLIRLLSYRVPGFMQVRLREHVVYYIVGILRECAFRTPVPAPMADVMVPEDLTDPEAVIAALLDQIDALFDSSEASRHQIPAHILTVMSIIRERYSENLSLESLAETVDVHPGHLSRSFHANVGVTLRHYLIRMRLEAAKDAMRSGERELRLIAEGTGFRNYSHFSSTFSKMEGISPSDYLRRYQ